LKTKNSQVAQFLGEVYQGVGDRMNDFVKSKVALQTTNETIFAQAVIGDSARVQRLQSEWLNATSSRTNSIAYRDELWRFAWHQYQNSAERRGTLSAPNLFMNRGRLLVGEGKYERAIPEFKTALAFAQTSSYDVVRQESVVHALRGIGVAYWSLRNYREARDWFLKAQDVQKKSARAWIPTLDDEVKRVTVLAAAQP
jgi:tetratricopeptide (TPR) repeat protein